MRWELIGCLATNHASNHKKKRGAYTGYWEPDGGRFVLFRIIGSSRQTCLIKLDRDRDIYDQHLSAQDEQINMKT
jgi:hypothetical protein